MNRPGRRKNYAPAVERDLGYEPEFHTTLRIIITGLSIRVLLASHESKVRPGHAMDTDAAGQCDTSGLLCFLVSSYLRPCG
jgi:hypothetical protein